MSQPTAERRARVAPSVLRLIATAMATAILALVAIAVALRPAAGTAPSEVSLWILAGLGVCSLVVGIVTAVTADPAAAGYRSRILVSLALRETAGLLGAAPTLLGAGPAWALGLGGAAIVSIVGLLPREG